MRELEKYVHARLEDELRKVRRDFATAMPELSDEVKAIIYKYTDDAFIVNDTLRESKGQKITPYAKHLDTALSILPDYKNIVFRGVRNTASRLKKYQNAFESRETIIEYGFTSASTKKEIAREYGTIILQIFSKRGKLIQNISKFGSKSGTNEFEVLFRYSTSFNVLEIIENGIYTFIQLEEI
jgi:hypothetical protein